MFGLTSKLRSYATSHLWSSSATPHFTQVIVLRYTPAKGFIPIFLVVIKSYIFSIPLTRRSQEDYNYLGSAELFADPPPSVRRIIYLVSSSSNWVSAEVVADYWEKSSRFARPWSAEVSLRSLAVILVKFYCKKTKSSWESCYSLCAVNSEEHNKWYNS